MYEKIKKLLIDYANIDEEKISPDANLKELGIDSLYAVEMVLELETAFDLQIEYEDMKSLKTVSDVVDLVNRKLEEK